MSITFEIKAFFIIFIATIHFNYHFAGVAANYRTFTVLKQEIMILRFILWSILLTIVFRFLVRFLFPLFNITRTVTAKMREMQEQMDHLNNQQQQTHRTSAPKQGEYIEYEEVK